MPVLVCEGEFKVILVPIHKSVKSVSMLILCRGTFLHFTGVMLLFEAAIYML